MQLLSYSTDVIITISVFLNDVLKSNPSAESIIDLVNAPNKNFELEKIDLQEKV